MQSLRDIFRLIEFVPNTQQYQSKANGSTYNNSRGQVVKVQYRSFASPSPLQTLNNSMLKISNNDIFYVPFNDYTNAVNLPFTNIIGNSTFMVQRAWTDMAPYVLVQKAPPKEVIETAVIAQQPVIVPPKDKSPKTPVSYVPLIKLVTEVKAINPTSYYETNGTIEVNVKSGHSPYTINLYKEKKLIYSGTDKVQFTSLSHGIYTISVTDTRQQFYSETVYIYQPQPVLTRGQASNMLDTLASKLNIEDAQRRAINKAFEIATTPDKQRTDLDYAKVIESILGKLSIDNELEAYYKVLENKRNGFVLPADKRGFDAEVIDENQMMDMIVRKLMGGQLVSDTKETNPLTRRIHTNTKPVLRQVKRNNAGFIISDDADSDKYGLDINMQDRKFFKSSFKNIIDTQFKEIDITAGFDETVAKLQDEVSKLKDQVNSYKSLYETTNAQNNTLASDKSDLQKSLANASNTIDTLLRQPEIEDDTFFRDKNNTIYHFKNNTKHRVPTYGLLQQLLKQRDKTFGDIKLLDDAIIQRYPEGITVNGKYVYPGDTYGTSGATFKAVYVLDLGWYIPQFKLDGTPLMTDDSKEENFHILGWMYYLAFEELPTRYQNKPNTQGFNFVKLAQDAFGIRSWALQAYNPKYTK